jgi:phosphatidylglycerophosphatase C
MANRGNAFDNMPACPSPSSTSTAPSLIATRCFRWWSVSSHAPARAALKQSLLRATLRGTPRAELHAASVEFVTDTIANRCFADALAAIRRHRGAGHYMVLMSASVDFYVPEFGRQLGFDQVIATGAAWNGDVFDGTLTTPNRRGEEKAVRLRELVAERKDGETFAYGNSASDLPHLRIARHGLLVNGSLAARREAATVGVPTAEWT